LKRKDLIKIIKENGAVFVRHGDKHDWYTNPQTGVSQPVPRHREIEDGLSKRIIKRLS